MSSGKVNRRALPAVENVREETKQIVLARHWWKRCWRKSGAKCLIGADRAREENFFELGGHSLLATQVMSRVREAFGVEVGLRELFERPTVKGLGQSIERELRQGAGVDASPIKRRRASGRVAAVICAAAFMVHRSACTGRNGLQHPGSGTSRERLT